MAVEGKGIGVPIPGSWSWFWGHGRKLRDNGTVRLLEPEDLLQSCFITRSFHGETTLSPSEGLSSIDLRVDLHRWDNMSESRFKDHIWGGRGAESSEKNSFQWIEMTESVVIQFAVITRVSMKPHYSCLSVVQSSERRLSVNKKDHRCRLSMLLLVLIFSINSYWPQAQWAERMTPWDKTTSPHIS